MDDFGRADLPVEDQKGDQLGMGKYATALASFIQGCQTPLTVGIQGEWGSGKTSLMSMVRQQIRSAKSADSTDHTEPLAARARGPAHATAKSADSTDHTEPPWIHEFETWQYGAAGDDGQLGVMLLSTVTGAIVEAHSDDGAIARMGSTVAKLAGVLGRALAAGTVSTVTAGALDGCTLIGEPGGRGASSADLGKLKVQFRDLVKRVIEKVPTKGGARARARFLLFIDDLDRVRPDRAVSLLEVLKNFMDVPGCVFIVACDYEVVREGVRMRFRINDEAKARAFFDKIIQVPFQMPVASYKIEGLLNAYLGERLTAPKGRAKNLAKELTPMVEIATGQNPRAFKRFLNTVDLHACLGGSASPGGASAESGSVWETKSATALIALVAMQLRWPRTASFLAGQADHEAIEATLAALREGFSEGEVEQVDRDLLAAVRADAQVAETVTSLSQNRTVSDLSAFAAQLWKVLDTDPTDQRLTDVELKQLIFWGSELSLTDVTRSSGRGGGWYQFEESVRSEPWGRWALSLINELWSERADHPCLSITRQADKFWVQGSWRGKMPNLVTLSNAGELRHNLTPYMAARHGLGVLAEAGEQLRRASGAGFTWRPAGRTAEVLSLRDLDLSKVGASLTELILATIRRVSSHLQETEQVAVESLDGAPGGAVGARPHGSESEPATDRT